MTHLPELPGRIVRSALALMIALATAVPVVPQAHRAHGAPTPQTIHVTVEPEALTLAADASFDVNVSTRMQVPTPYLEVRFQLRSPSGRLLFQRTEVRNQVETSTVDVTFTRELTDLSLDPGRYPFEVRVRTETGEPREQTIDGALLLHASDTASTPVALAIRVREAPSFDPEGRFVVDPAANDATRQGIARLTAAIGSDPDLRLTLALSPVILDQWSRIASGYQVVGPAGVTDVAADAATPQSYRQTLQDLKDALATGRLELLNTPYADPDIAGLVATRALQDLGVHYARGMSSYLAVLETTPSAGTAFSSNTINTAALAALSERDVDFVLLDPDTLVSGEGTATPGPWSVADTSLVALALDVPAAGLISSMDTTATLEHVFGRVISETPTLPVAAVCDVGPGSTTDVDAVIRAARALNDTPWAHSVLMAEAAAYPAIGDARPIPSASTADAPVGYWDDVAATRRVAYAFELAVGVNDPDAQAVADASLISQSRCWAGVDGGWGLADRGRSFSAAATRHARSFLDQVTLVATDITLSGPRGDVPLSITNNSAKNLTVTLKARGDGIHIADGGSRRVTLRPQENFETIGIDLQSSLVSNLTVELWSSEVMLASSSATVRASYLDRLVVIAGVVLVLLGLLLFIRRRVLNADAGTMR